jgi:choice-of-anchor B domain-containing protein
MTRVCLLFLLAGCTVPAARAQTACVNGFAGPYACERADLLSHLPVSTFASPGSGAPGANNDIWGWTDPQTGREYALVGLDNGTAFVDITTPTQPTYLGKLPTATSPSLWRDIKVYQNHAFIVAEAGSHGMQVFDLTRLRGVSGPPRTFTADARYTGAGSAHNIVIDENSGMAFMVGATQGGFQCNGGGLHMVRITTPTAPSYAGCYDDDGYTHDAQCIRYDGPDATYTGRSVCMALNEDTVTFVDVTVPSSPAQISRVFYPSPGYTHQGWWTEDRRHAIVDDELDGPQSPTTRTLVLETSDLDNPGFAFAFFGPITARDHNLYVRGGYVYQSNYSGGLRILDARSVAQGTMEEVGYFDTYPADDTYSFDGQWSNYPYFPSGVVVANDQNNGLFVIQPDPQFVVAESAAPGESARFELSAAQPNPASERAEVTLRVDTPQRVTAQLFDLTGRDVETVRLARTVDASAPVVLDISLRALTPGVYILRVTGETFQASRRIVVSR